MANWIRRPFGAAGLTQVPPGPHLGALQGHFGGTVMLCLVPVATLWSRSSEVPARASLRLEDRRMVVELTVMT